MNNKNEIVKLTCGEISALWGTYINDSVVICLMAHFIETCSDPDILPLLKKTRNIAEQHMIEVEHLFIKEQIAVPEGFKPEKHVVTNAPKLFSDLFYVQYVQQMCRFALTSHTSGFSIAARDDIRKMFNQFFDDTSLLYNEVVNVMQEKGIFVRMPFMNYPTQVEFIHKEDFLTGWFGRRRSLLGIEVTHLMINYIQNEIGKATCIGFSQVAKEKEIRDYFLHGRHLCKHILSSIHDVLMESDIPTGMSWDQTITNSTVAPYSDQLMVFVVGMLSNLGMITYGAGLGVTMRRDISAMYAGFITKAGDFGEDGLNLMIERGWMEQPPKFEDREQLSKGKQ
ncbi:DUF3231 family protein [Neobacillus sp. LXY-1]|uniref:DUF3231 family protein n=1 Tax=Neobacillus sp. LXY-1 TaxID=3379133 RepID=UPI003EDFD4A3